MILLECTRSFFSIGLSSSIMYLDIGILLIFILLLVTKRILVNKKIWLKLSLVLGVVIITNILLVGISLNSSMTFSEASLYYEKNKQLIEDLVSLYRELDILDNLSIGTTCDGDWRLKIGNGSTYVYSRDNTEKLLAKTDSLGIDTYTVNKILYIIDTLNLVAVQRDEYDISIGVKSYGFDERSQIKYCLKDKCDGELIESKYYIKNDKPIW